MEQSGELAGLKEPVRIFERLAAAARLAAVYSDKKKILRYVYKTLKFERKQFGRSCYPLADGYSRTILFMFSEFSEALEKLIGARRPEDYTRAYARFEEVVARIFREYDALNAALAERAADEARKSAIGDIAEKLEAGAQKVGETIEAGAQKLGAFFSEGLKSLKNTVKAHTAEETKPQGTDKN